MEWNRSNAIGLALASCTQCAGHGMREIQSNMEIPCSCVFRAIFRACYRRFRECASPGVFPGAVSLDHLEGPIGKRIYGLKREEYMADFCLVAKRVLDEEEYRIFRFHHLLGADYRLCCRQLKLERSVFFRIVHRLERKLGRAFREIEPYPLFPLSDYFTGPAKEHHAKVVEIRTDAKKPVSRLSPFLRKAA